MNAKKWLRWLHRVLPGLALAIVLVFSSVPAVRGGEDGSVSLTLRDSRFYQINRWLGPNPPFQIVRLLRVHTSGDQWFWISFQLPEEYKVGWKVESAVLKLRVFDVTNPVDVVVKNDDEGIAGRETARQGAKWLSVEVTDSLRAGEGKFMLYVYGEPVSGISAGASFYSPSVQPESLQPALSVVLKRYIYEPCCVVQRIDPEMDVACKEGARAAGDPDWNIWRGIYFCECRGEGTGCPGKHDGFLCIKGEPRSRPGPNDCGCR